MLRNTKLRALFVNSQLFGGSMMAASPLLTVLMLRDLGCDGNGVGVVEIQTGRQTIDRKTDEQEMSMNLGI